ncbi:LPXTG cell wall anchor domain-containing protein, partial [Lactiplantibacillus plantarum]|uniref:Cna B-type domain-containing protein n=1 Tax=Lactiplantibacillus plantarum TaxID=1590 RepID=UPI002A74D53C
KAITYTVKEDSVKNYKATIDGFNINNTYKPTTPSSRVRQHRNKHNNLPQTNEKNSKIAIIVGICLLLLIITGVIFNKYHKFKN